jgi:predicted esterase
MRYFSIGRLGIAGLLALFVVTACSSNDDIDSGDSDTGEVEPGLLTPGLYQLGLSVSPAGGLIIEFQLDLDVEVDEQDETSISFDIRPVDAGGGLGDSMGRIEEVSIQEDLSFEAPLGEMTLLGPYSPTGSPVVLDATLHGSLTSSSSFCGSVTGEIVTFSMDLEGSTFAGLPWEERSGDLVKAECEDPVTEELVPIADCPALAEGRNLDFPSGEVSREFELILPEAYDASQEWPLVFAWHGISSSIESIMSSADLEAAAENYGAIFVVPQSAKLGGVDAWDPVNGEELNRDVLFFDDMLTCMKEQYAIDTERVSTTGISNGGLLSGVLIVERSSVISAAAPMSGGISLPYQDVERKMPTLVLWGGETDEAYEQSFHNWSTEMIETLVENDHFVVSCNHGMGHHLEPSFMDIVMPFLLAHPKDVEPLPYLDGLPESYPSYCYVASDP